MNNYNNTKSVYEYYIYLPICENKSYEILNSLNENKAEEEMEKLRNLFIVKSNKYYFEIKNNYNEFGYFTLNKSIISDRILISNNEYILDFIVTKQNKSVGSKIDIKYIVSVEDEEAYSKECKITLTFQACYHSCHNCSKDINNSNNLNHNCLSCKFNYYPSPQNPNNCYAKEEKKTNWYFDEENSIFGFCHDKCSCSCTGPNNNDCLPCTNELYFDITYNHNEINISDTDINNSEIVMETSNLRNDFIESISDITLNDFKNQIKNDITSLINSSKVINGSNFLAVVLSSDNMEPEEQIKNGISAIDLGNCTNVIKEYYNISNEESLIVLNMELKNDDYQKSQTSNDDDKSFNLCSNTQLEIYDYSGRKLNLSICREDIKVMKPLNNFENQFDMNSAKSLSEQGIDVFDKNDKFFNDICHPYDNSEGKDITLNDRRKDIYQDVTFCQNGCNYNGINYNLNAVNCICDSSYLQDENKTNNENEPKISKFESITESFIASLISFNFDILRCYNLSFNIKILLSNIGFYCLLLMFVLQLIFFFIYLIKKLKPLKNFLLLYQKNKRRNIKNDAMRNPPPKNSIKKSFINGNNINKNSNNKKKYIKNDFNKKKHNKLYNKNDIITNNNKGRRSLNNIIVEDAFNKLKIDSSNNILSSSKHSKYTNLKKGKLIRNKYALNINIESPIINNNNENIYNTKLKKYQFNKKGNNIKDIHKIETLQGIIYKKNIKSKINKENIIILSKSDSELQDLDYEEAIIYDKRSFLRMCWGFLVDSQIILGTFCTDNHLDLFVIKLSFLVFTFQISFFLNALFYTDEYISDAYHNDGVLDFFSGLPKCIYSFIATLITTNLLRMLSSSKNELIKVIRSNTKFSNFKSLINIKLKKLRIKLIIYFILLFALESLFLYYVTVFCAVYRNSQKYWFLGCLQSFGIDFLTAFAGCIFLSLFRYISIKKHIKCLYIFTNIINAFL